MSQNGFMSPDGSVPSLGEFGQSGSATPAPLEDFSLSQETLEQVPDSDHMSMEG